MEKLKVYAGAWRAYKPRSTVYTERTIGDALEKARAISRDFKLAHILITGSLHLVSGALRILETEEK